MIIDNNYEKDDSEEGGKSGTGGKSGEIHFKFRDAMSLPPRDDALPPSELKRLLTVHVELHKQRVDKQKTSRQERAAIKAGKTHIQSLNQRALGQSGGGSGSKYKKHPISNSAYFSGDRQTIGLPTEYNAETNLEAGEKLENRFVNRQVPRFNPKPRPPGG